MPDYDLTFSEGTCYQNSKHDISKYRPVPMPSRNTTADDVARAADKCLRFTAGKYFPMVELGDLADIVSGGTPDTSNDKFWDGDIVWVTPKDLGRPHNIYIDNSERKITSEGLSSSSAKLLPIGTVLLSSRAPIGHLAISKVPLSTNQGFKNIICSQKLDNRYLFHILRASIEELQNLGRGNTFKEIPARLVSQLKIPIPPLNVQTAIAEFLDAVYLRVSGYTADLPLLPPPLSEQRRIVARIEELASRIEEAQRLREEVNNIAGSIAGAQLNRIFGNPYAGIQGTLASAEFAPLDDVVMDVADGPHVTPQYVNDGVPFITVQNITSGRINFTNTKFVSEEDHQQFQRRAKATKGDVLISKDGTIGIPCYIDTDRDFSFFVSVALVKPKRDQLNGEYLSWVLRAPYLQERMLRVSRGDMIRHLVLREIRRLLIPVPSLSEQHSITAQMDALQQRVRSLEILQHKSNKEVNALLPSILDKAFKGEL